MFVLISAIHWNYEIIRMSKRFCHFWHIEHWKISLPVNWLIFFFRYGKHFICRHTGETVSITKKLQEIIRSLYLILYFTNTYSHIVAISVPRHSLERSIYWTMWEFTFEIELNNLSNINHPIRHIFNPKGEAAHKWIATSM